LGVASRSSGARRPLVGITTYHRDGGARPRFQLPSAYVDAVRGAGGIALLLAPGDERPAELLGAVDALLLCGGGDLDPELFGASPHPSQYSTCAERDLFDLELARAAVQRALPLLAICRGMQVLNVALGGSLHVHLPDAVGEGVAHRASQEEPTRHAVRLDPASHLARIFGVASLSVASWHHQGVARLGRGLQAVAWAEDGTVEALELEGRPEVLAVQWHPELQIEGKSPQLRLFAALVQAARRLPRPGS
jgi:putative glutamine amidotransferase